MRCVRGLILAAALAMAASNASADRVKLRDDQPAIDGKVTVINEDGITIEAADQPQRVVPWDRVQSWDQSRDEPKRSEYETLALKLWRARSRVERGDARLALSLFEELAPKYRGRTSETALVVMEGLLRCRLDQGANDLAIVPWLEVARLRLKGVTSSSYSALSPVVDEATMLCTVLPPVWAASPSLVKVERQLAEYDAGTEPRVTAYARMYRQAIRKQLGMSVETFAGATSEQSGAQLMMNILETSAAAPEVRQGSRERLLRQTEDMSDWAQAWANYFVGASLLLEIGDGRSRDGLVSLLTVPARFWATQPYLAGLALAKSSQALAAAGNTDDAATVDEELRRSFPNHPVLVAGGHRPISRSPKDSS